MRRLLWLIVLLVLVVLVLAVRAAGRKQPVAELGVPNTGSAALSQATSSPAVAILPATILQGDPAEIVVSGATSTEVRSLTYNGKSLAVFDSAGMPTAAVGIDLKAKSGSYPVVVTLADGTVLKKELVVGTRQIAVAPLGIPESLGGNTPQAAQNLVAQLAKDNAILNSVRTVDQKLWSGAFGYPVANPVVTDTYGYTRDTVNTSISHKGTDFHAPPGTSVFAMNGGIVRLARFFTAYGNTVVIDHGFGIQTMYMHLSSLEVGEGDKVNKGDEIGQSGTTGYAEGPHLHISVKIGGISIDPEKFLKLF